MIPTSALVSGVSNGVGERFASSVGQIALYPAAVVAVALGMSTAMPLVAVTAALQSRRDPRAVGSGMKLARRMA